MQLHYAVENDTAFGAVEIVAACGNDFRRVKKLAEDWTEVTCPTCRKLLGLPITDAVHSLGFASDEQVARARAA